MKPLVRANYVKEPEEELILSWMEHFSATREEALKRIAEDHTQTETYVNDIYQVEVRRYHEGKMVQINIRRRDGNVIFRDWRHFQQIKNEILGEECEAIELYPAESRLVDTSNKYHLWGIADPTFRFPVGYDERHVFERGGGVNGPSGLRQRPIVKSGKKNRNTDDR